MELRKLKTVMIPEEIIPLVEDLGNGDSIDKSAVISIAIGLFVAKSVSLAREAEIAGLSLNDFIYLLKTKNIPWGEYTEKDMVEDDIAIKEFFKEYENE